MTSWPNTVTLGGIVLDELTDTSQRVTSLVDGWTDGAPARTNRQSKAQQDGNHDATGHLGERVIPVNGFIEESTPAAADAVMRQLTALRPQGLYELVVDNASVGTLSATVRVEVSAKTAWIGDTRFEYAITVAAPDPLLYGPPTFDSAGLADASPGAGLTYPLTYPLDYGVPPGVTPGAVLVPNAGTAAYWPRLRIDGPVLNPVISLVETGAWVRYNGSLLAGQWLDWDMANRRVLLQGQVSVRQRVTSSGNWLAIPVGGGSIAWTADSADPAARLSVWGYERAVS